MTAPRAKLVACLAALAIAGTACSLPRTLTQADEPTPQHTYAMTGLPAPPGAKDRPVIVVKIENTVEGRPQRGVNSADMVIEEPVEGGLTRLAVFFESRWPESVGPVRSARISDIGMVQPVGATVVASGGAPRTLAAFKAAGVKLIDEAHRAMVRDPERAMPNNLFVDLTALTKADIGRPPKQPYFEFGTPSLPPGPEADNVTVVYSQSHREEWRWESRTGVWVRADIGDQRITAPTILVCVVRLTDAGYRDAAGSRVPIVDTTGTGNGYLLVNGHVHAISWRKPSQRAQWEISTRAGLVMPVPTGRVWMALIQRGQGKVSFTPRNTRSG